MKKTLSIILCLCLVFLSACTKQKSDKKENLSIVTTIFPIYDFARAIAGETADIKMLIKPAGEVHSYDPLPSDMKAVYTCDLFLYIGGESDAWVDKILSDTKANSYPLINCTDNVYEEGESVFDEHIWTSPDNAVKMLDKILELIIKLDSKNADTYRQNHKEYTDEIKKQQAETKELINGTSNPFILVADRFPFRYFADSYGITYLAAADGCAISLDISLKKMNELVNEVQKKGLKYAYYTELSNKKIADALSEQTGVSLIELHSAHNVSLEDFNSGITYVDIMKRNKNAIRKGLK